MWKGIARMARRMQWFRNSASRFFDILGSWECNFGKGLSRHSKNVACSFVLMRFFVTKNGRIFLRMRFIVFWMVWGF
jgi:hypothetical protein